MLGKLKEEQTEQGQLIMRGYLRTYSLDLEFKLDIKLDRATDKVPTHDILARGKHGKTFHAGVAWQGKDKNGNTMYTLSFVVPELLDEELRTVAFDAKDGTFEIRVSREKEEVEQGAAQAA